MKIILTGPLRNHPKKEKVMKDVVAVLAKFQEMQGKILTVGVTKNGGGHASFEDFKININPDSKLYSFNTIAHELTHLLQSFTDIPHGEKACEIWTYARDEMFLDDAPVYLQIPESVVKDWERYKLCVRELCIDAIERRKNGLRRYIAWLESEIKKLV